MKCPIDGETLTMANREGVEIDYCPKCRGVWLDRGELDKIIERSTQAAPEPVNHQQRPNVQGDRHAEPRRYHDDDDRGYSRRPKRRESFLSELFDF